MHQPRGHADGGRGADLLLTHCMVLATTEAVRPSAFARLEEQLGGELARMLVVALASRRRERVAA